MCNPQRSGLRRSSGERRANTRAPGLVCFWSLPGLRDIEGFQAMWADFLAVLRHGAEPRMTLPRARLGLELILSSTRSHEPVARATPALVTIPPMGRTLS